MAYTAITSGEIAAGEPTKQELFTKTKDNFDDHEARLTAAELQVNKFNPISWDYVNVTGTGIIQDGLFYGRAFTTATIVGVRVLVWDAGTAGSLTIDVQKKTGAGAFASVLNTPISVASGSGNLALGSGSIATSSVSAGDIFRVDVDAVQTQGRGFSVYIEFEGA